MIVETSKDVALQRHYEIRKNAKIKNM